MNIFLNIIGKLFGWDKEYTEYWARFIDPQVNRLKSLGVTNDQCQQLIKIAFNVATPEIIGHAPGSILANIADHIEAGDVTAAKIIADHS